MHASYFLRDASLMFNKQEQQVGETGAMWDMGL
jgi:hypothetical protein